MSKIDEFYENLKDGRCKGCKDARRVSASQGFSFLGCYHEPNKGKNVTEIKDCPKTMQEKVDEITTEMIEHVCDNICKHLGNVSDTGITQDELEEICCECKMGEYVCNLLNLSENGGLKIAHNPATEQEKERLAEYGA
ncbi:MAG: hypothetical protein ACERKN_07225 [Velocimicrobium sp.]